MSVFLPYLVSLLQAYGYPVLWLSIFVAAIGLPLPISLVLLAAGAFAALGDFNIIALAAIAVSASVCGDSVGYFIGRRWGSRVLAWLEHSQQKVVSARTIERSRTYFTRRGGWAVFLSRFLFPVLGGVTNLLAGSELYAYKRFLPYDIVGEVLGACIPLTLGFLFGASWEAVGDILGAVSLFFLALLLAIFIGMRLLAQIRTLRQLAANEAASKNARTHTANAPERPPGTSSASGRLPL